MKDDSKSKNYKKQIIYIIRMLCIILFIISAGYIINWYIDIKENAKLEEQIKENVIKEEENVAIYTEMAGIVDEVDETEKYIVDFEPLKAINNDTVAWLKVPGTDVEYAIVQTTNNNYYLYYNFKKKYNVAGWIFADYKNKLDGTDKNIVIYGHNMKDGSMFGSLTNILKKSWYNNEENYIIEFITEQEECKYQVFSVYKIEPEDYYITTSFKGSAFKKFINTLKKRSIKDFGVEVTEKDNILTLSTCDNTYTKRIVLHAKKIK